MASGEIRKIFVVEDDFDIRESILEVLQSGGFETESASNAKDAIAVLRALHPKPYLILLDLRLPGQDGFQFREEQLRDPAIADIPVILLSADAQLEEKSARLGAIGHLTKPVTIDQLLDTVRKNYLN